MFSNEEKEILKSKCRSLIVNGKITATNVKLLLKGEELYKKYTFEQLQSRIQYIRKINGK